MNQITPITKNIIIINVAFFILSYLADNYGYNFRNLIVGYFPLSPNFHSWQVITHMFMHGGLMHIAFNMLTLFSFGPVLEQIMGGKKFLWLYLLSGLGGFIIYNIYNFVNVYTLTQYLESNNIDIHSIYKYATLDYTGERPIGTNSIEVQEKAQSLFNILSIPMVGASGAIFGVVAAFSTLFPDAKMMMMFIPVPIKAKYILPVIIVISVFLGVKQFDWDNIAHFAHIGGALIGFLIAYQWKKDRFKI